MGRVRNSGCEQAGYNNIASSSENAFAYSTSVEEAMQAFLIDWGVPSDGHRINIQQPGVSAQNAYRDVGIGIVQTSPSNPNFGPLVITQDFASQTNEQAQVVGVAYNDNSNTGFYQVGEGQGGVQIDAVNLQTGQVFSTQTWASGGYELSLAPGQYTIIASVNDDVIQTANLTMGSVNVEQDFILTNAWQGGTREGAIAAAQPQACSGRRDGSADHNPDKYRGWSNPRADQYQQPVSQLIDIAVAKLVVLECQRELSMKPVVATSS